MPDLIDTGLMLLSSGLSPDTRHRLSISDGGLRA
jgi:hypothetical protein